MSQYTIPAIPEHTTATHDRRFSKPLANARQKSIKNHLHTEESMINRKHSLRIIAEDEEYRYVKTFGCK